VAESGGPVHEGEVAIRHGWLGRRMRELGLASWITFAWIAEDDSGAWGLLVGLALLAASPLTWLAFPRPGKIRIERGGLVIERGRPRFVPDDRIEGAWVDATQATFDLRGGDRILFRGPSRVALLADARTDAGSFASRVRLLRPVRWYAAFLVGLITQLPLVLGVQSIAVSLGAGDDLRDSVGITFGLVSMFFFLRWASTSTLVVGLDGILVPRTLGARFVPYRDVARVDVHRARTSRGPGMPVVRIALHSGRTLAVSDVGGPSHEAFVARVEEARRAAERAHRRAAGDVLHDPHAPVAERLAAAAQRRAEGGAAGLAEVLAVRRASADPALRRGLRKDVRHAPSVVKGPDGLRLEGRRGAVVVPYSAIASFAVEGAAVRLGLPADRVVRAPLAGLDARDRAALVEVLEAARAPAPPSHARFGRQGRDVSSWRDGVVALVEREEGYREVPVTVADARAALEAPTSRAEERLGAALALARGSEADRARVEAVAVRAAAPSLCRALEAVLDDRLDDAAVVRAAHAEVLDDEAWAAIVRAGFAGRPG